MAFYGLVKKTLFFWVPTQVRVKMGLSDEALKVSPTIQSDCHTRSSTIRENIYDNEIEHHMNVVSNLMTDNEIPHIVMFSLGKCEEGTIITALGESRPHWEPPMVMRDMMTLLSIHGVDGFPEDATTVEDRKGWLDGLQQRMESILLERKLALQADANKDNVYVPIPDTEDGSVTHEVLEEKAEGETLADLPEFSGVKITPLEEIYSDGV